MLILTGESSHSDVNIQSKTDRQSTSGTSATALYIDRRQQQSRFYTCMHTTQRGEVYRYKRAMYKQGKPDRLEIHSLTSCLLHPHSSFNQSPQPTPFLPLLHPLLHTSSTRHIHSHSLKPMTQPPTTKNTLTSHHITSNHKPIQYKTLL
jgi:hypothetical protein